MKHNVKYLDTLTRDQAEKVFSQGAIALLPIGATEQHGHHLPLGTDTFLATELVSRIASHINAVVLPAIPYGYSWVWRKIPGTITLKESLVESLIREVAQSLHQYNAKGLVVFSGHEANSAAMKYAIRDLSDLIDMKVVYCFYPGFSDIVNNHMESPLWNNMIHAEEFETSLMLATAPHLVNMDLAVEEYPEVPIDYGKTALPLGDMSKSGVFGNAKLGSKEKGELFFELVTHKSIELITYIFKEIA